MLKDDTEEVAQKCDDFFNEQLPNATLSMKRPKSRIYSIPADSITLAELFRKMQNGQDSEFGITYYTCSSSSLERVFMEIVQMSENEEESAQKENDKSNEKIAKSSRFSKNQRVSNYDN